MPQTPVTKFNFTFNHQTKLKSFGPYETADEAREAFQRVYGYWPEKLESWTFYDPALFEFTTAPQDDGTVNVYIEWGDDQGGDLLNFETDEEARKYLTTPLEATRVFVK